MYVIDSDSFQTSHQITVLTFIEGYTFLRPLNKKIRTFYLRPKHPVQLPPELFISRRLVRTFSNGGQKSGGTWTQTAEDL